MFPIDPLWVYIAVPTILISVLILIKLKQEKAVGAEEAWKQRAVNAFPQMPEEEEQQPIERKFVEESPQHNAEGADEPQPTSESSEDPKPEGCAKFLGYLYLKKAPDKTHIPSECYNCAKLLQCLYSPHLIQKVYGE